MIDVNARVIDLFVYVLDLRTKYRQGIVVVINNVLVKSGQVVIDFTSIWFHRYIGNKMKFCTIA